MIRTLDDLDPLPPLGEIVKPEPPKAEPVIAEPRERRWIPSDSWPIQWYTPGPL